jgi:molybdopterin synthase sulfur carrier subunit
MPTVTVRYFAILRERRRRDAEVIEVPAGTTLGDLYTRLFPGSEAEMRVAYARNQQVASATDLVGDGDEIAFLPPVGGG